MRCSSRLPWNAIVNSEIAHEEALDLLMLRVRKILDLEHVQGDPIRFLQTVLQDYVILTR